MNLFTLVRNTRELLICTRHLFVEMVNPKFLFLFSFFFDAKLNAFVKLLLNGGCGTTAG